MILEVGPYSLTQRIRMAEGLKEFSDEEYLHADVAGIRRVLEDERIFNGVKVQFAATSWDSTTVASTQGQIYKIILQFNSRNKALAKRVLQTTVGFVNREVGKYNKHSLFSKKYAWDAKDGNIILYEMRGGPIFSVNIFFTSNMILSQKVTIVEGACQAPLLLREPSQENMTSSSISTDLVKALLQIARGSLEPKPNLLSLVTTICEIAERTSDLFDEYLVRWFPENSQEFLRLRLNVFLAMASFLAHLASSIVFREFGPLKRNALNDYVGLLLVEFAVTHFYEPISKDSSIGPLEEFKQYFYNYLNASEREYGSCKAWILKEEEDVAFADKVVGGEKSKGMIDLLTDKVVSILNEDNPITYHNIMLVLLSSIDTKEFKEIVLRTGKEL